MVAFYEEAFYLRNNPLPTSTSLVFKTTIKSRLGGGGGGGRRGESDKGGKRERNFHVIIF